MDRWLRNSLVEATYKLRYTCQQHISHSGNYLMPTAAERQRHVTAKLERARNHLHEFKQLHDTFLKSNPYKVGVKRDIETRKLIYHIASVEQPEDGMSTAVGDILKNLISALDHLAYQLVCIGMGSDGPFYHEYFPIADSFSEYEAKKRRKVQGMTADAIKAIDEIKPYKGGNDLLWRLYKLNNIDKHRLLITVGSAFRSVNVGALMHRMMQKTLEEKGVSLPTLDLYLRPADRLFPLKAGDELFIDAPDAEVNDKMQFCFDVAFGETQIVEGEPLLETLNQLIGLVEQTVTKFEPLLNWGVKK